MTTSMPVHSYIWHRDTTITRKGQKFWLRGVGRCDVLQVRRDGDYKIVSWLPERWSCTGDHLEEDGIARTRIIEILALAFDSNYPFKHLYGNSVVHPHQRFIMNPSDDFVASVDKWRWNHDDRNPKGEGTV